MRRASTVFKVLGALAVALLFSNGLSDAQFRRRPKEAREIRVTTVAELEEADIGQMACVTDGADVSDCTVGGGSTVVFCMADGSAWKSISVALSAAGWTYSGTTVALATSTDLVALEGQIQIKGGAPALDKVLTSDANGLAIWKLPSGGGFYVTIDI